MLYQEYIELTETRQIALEANVLSNAVQTLKNTYSYLVNKFSPSYESVKNLALGFSKEILPKKITNTKQMSSQVYLDFSDTRIEVPIGYTGNYLLYGLALKDNIKYCSSIVSDTLDPYAAFIGSLINNSDVRNSTKTVYEETEKRAKEREGQMSITSAYLVNSQISEQQVKDVVKRANDLPIIYNTARDIQNFLEKTEPKKVLRKIEECRMLNDSFLSKIEKGSIEKISPEVATQLSDKAFNTASECEFYSITVYRALAYVKAIDKLRESAEAFMESYH